MKKRVNRRGGLSAEDRAIWQRVIATVTRRARPDTDKLEAAKENVVPPTGQAPPDDDLPAGDIPLAQFTPFEMGARPRPPTQISRGSQDDASASQLDRRTAERLRKGQLPIDETLDLHGLTVDRAHQILSHRVAAAHARGARLMLVITGKGSRQRAPADMFERPGILREMVPHWLREAPMAGFVLQFHKAQPHHGGTGALYVYLRRKR